MTPSQPLRHPVPLLSFLLILPAQPSVPRLSLRVLGRLATRALALWRCMGVVWLALASAVVSAQGAPEWSSFALPNNPLSLDTPVDEVVFKDIDQEGPWKASQQAQPSPDTLALLDMLAQSQWAKALDWLKQRHPDLNMPDIKGRMPLSMAAQAGQLVLVREMLRRGAETERIGGAGMTPLGAAVWGGHDLVVADLLQVGARLDTPSATGQLPLHLASQTGNTRLIKTLMAAGADWRWPNKMGHHAVSEAAYHGHIPALRTLVAAGASLKEPDATRLNALHAAALAGNTRMIRWLSRQGVPVPSPITRTLIQRLPLPACTPEMMENKAAPPCQWYPPSSKGR